MTRLTVIGIGSPFGDDRAGWHVANALAESKYVAAYGELIVVTACRSPAGELPGLFANTEIAVVVDAVLDGGAPGTVYRMEGRHFPAFAGRSFSSHGIALQTILEVSDVLKIGPNATIVYGIEAEFIGTASVMSESARRAAAWVVDNIKRDMAHYCADTR